MLPDNLDLSDIIDTVPPALLHRLHSWALIGTILLVALCGGAIVWIVVNSRRLRENAAGYLHYPFGFQHRLYAERYLGRRLRPGEEIHHINGRTGDNHPDNLCVLYRDDHRAFHVWVAAERRMLDRYPPIAVQKDMLSTRFNGILVGPFYAARKQR